MEDPRVTAIQDLKFLIKNWRHLPTAYAVVSSLRQLEIQQFMDEYGRRWQ